MEENNLAKFVGPPYTSVWRIGNLQDPLAFAPHQYSSWAGRFDDPQRSYRTLYCTEGEATALREVLAPFRPGLIESSLVKFNQVVKIPRKSLREKIIIPARIEVSSGSLVDVADIGLYDELGSEVYGTLEEYGIRSLDLYSIVHNRHLSRIIGRMLYEKGAAGLAYPSIYASGLCFALFEGRARLISVGSAKSLEEAVNARPDLLEILRPSISAQHYNIYQLNHIDLLLYSHLQSQPELLRTLDWRIFEKLLADILETFGYTVDLTRPTKDGGIDIIAFGKPEPWGEHRYLIQAKRWSNRVGVEPVRELMFLHNELKATRSCLATTSTFTKGAWELSEGYRWQLELRDYDGIREWIEKAIRLKRRAKLVESK